ncbi:hypothetical protein [Kushneria phosphatilytica]|uniref:Lipid/polyisoprenoid-binding YceI-like domain-containing protein n=1 Tax=Kushneria phosphatilytica TaxID=657387 RepID=A0A5C1A148_9GAMM|nr:hypothetical protein [Kushneria phosphatilytica]QEL10635.1 hypothetical protein FY550_05480 [Kushneria phosphatilytica]
MRLISLTAIALGGLMAVTLSTAAEAAWRFNPDQSRITAVVTDQRPSGNVPHTYHVSQLDGTIDDDGNLTLPLSLSQTDLLKDQGNLAGLLSGFSKSPMATLHTKVDPQWLSQLNVGESITRNLPIRARGNHFDRTERVPLKLTRTAEHRYHVTTAEPISVDTRQLMQLDNAQTVLSLLGYNKLTDTIPINFEAQLVPAG